jgi:kynurenine formamidase
MIASRGSPGGPARGSLRTAAIWIRRGEALSLSPAADDPLALARPILERAPAEPIATRGVLLDVAREARRAWLPDAVAISTAALDTCAERCGIVLEPRDAVLVRTGFRLGCASFAGEASWREGAAPGLAAACADWLHARGASLVALDTPSVEQRVSRHPPQAFRERANESGLLLGTGFALEELAAACARDREWAFVFACPPARDDGAVDPLALR